MPLDPEELGRHLDRYWSVLVAWVGGAYGEAEDIVQSAFVKLAAEDPPPDNCGAWLFTVTRRLALNAQLSRKNRRVREQLVASNRPSSSTSTNQTLPLELRDILNALDEREREVVIARVWGELTFDEIAALKSEAKATVWRVYQSGLTKLRQAYERDHHA